MFVKYCERSHLVLYIESEKKKQKKTKTGSKSCMLFGNKLQINAYFSPRKITLNSESFGYFKEFQ
jgi:hypothetical protein